MMFIGIGIFVGTFLVAIILKVSIGLAVKKHKRKKKDAAVSVLTPILKEIFGEDMSYDRDGRIDNEHLEAPGFFGGYDTITGSDLVRGHYRGVPLTFSDIHLQESREVRDDDGHKKTEYTTIFKGLWLFADFDRELAPDVLSIKEKDRNNAIKMESEAFNKKFGVYCKNEHTAFYILTPHFMERLLAIESKTKGTMYLQLAGKRMYFTLNSYGDFFELGFFKKADPEEMQTRFRAELKQITDIFDEILQHERMFGAQKDMPAAAPAAAND